MKDGKMLIHLSDKQCNVIEKKPVLNDNTKN